MVLVIQSEEVHRDAGGKEGRASEKSVTREELSLVKPEMSFYLTFPQSDFEALGGMPRFAISDHRDSLGWEEGEVVSVASAHDWICSQSRLSEKMKQAFKTGREMAQRVMNFYIRSSCKFINDRSTKIRKM